MKNILYFIFINALYISCAYSCPITLNNDTPLPVLVFDQTSLQYALIQAEQEATLGSPTTHPHMYIGQQNASAPSNPIQYEVIMTGCAASKTPLLITFSDVKNNQLPAVLTVKDHTQQPAMNALQAAASPSPKKGKMCGCKKK